MTQMSRNSIAASRAILQSAQDLKRAIDSGNTSRIQYAIQDLDESARAREPAAVSFGFSESPSAQVITGVETETRDEVQIPDALLGVLTDLQTANVLMAAGKATGEVDGTTAGPHELDHAIAALDQTTVEAAAPAPATFGFTERPASTKPEEARTTFQSECDQTFTALISEVRGVTGSLLEKLSHVDGKKIAAFIGDMGQVQSLLQPVGRLFQKGVDLAAAALRSLQNLLGEKAIGFLREKLGGLWEELTSGKLADSILGRVFNLEALRKQAAAVEARADLAVDPLDHASTELSALRESLKQSVSVLVRIAGAVGAASTLLALTPISAGASASLVASSYVLLLGAAILIGMDYADSENVLNRIDGIGHILSRI